MINLLILFFFYFLISLTLIGYGAIFLRLFYKHNKIINFGYLGIFGLVLSIFISYFTNFFFPHNFTFNSIYVFCGIAGLIFLFKSFRFQILKQEFLFFVTVFIFAFISLLIFKNHDDFPYYHFVYTYNLTQFDLNVGIGQFNHGFRTPSSIFYINSLFYLPFINYFSFNFAAVFVLAFSNIILLKKIGIGYSKNFFYLERDINYKNEIIFFSLLSLIFVNIFFYRIGEHGTDRSAQILIMLLVVEVMIALSKKSLDEYLNLKIYTLIIFIISLKAFYILYLLILIPVYIQYFRKQKLTEFILKNFCKSYLILYLCIFLLILSTYFFSTGCLLYPIAITCFESFSWSIPLSQVESMNIWYQQWSKAGAAPGFRIEDPEIYILEFNWVNNWIDKYFFNKVSDFLLGIMFLSLVFFTAFKISSEKKFNFKIKKIYILFYSLILILFFEWFYNHPALRYGGFNLIAIIFFFPLSIYLSSFKITNEKFRIVTTLLIIITLAVFFGRNINRINKEHIIYNYNPLNDPFYQINNNYFDEYNNIKTLISNYNNCEQNKNCNTIKVKKNFGTYIFKN